MNELIMIVLFMIWLCPIFKGVFTIYNEFCKTLVITKNLLFHRSAMIVLNISKSKYPDCCDALRVSDCDIEKAISIIDKSRKEATSEERKQSAIRALEEAGGFMEKED